MPSCGDEVQDHGALDRGEGSSRDQPTSGRPPRRCRPRACRCPVAPALPRADLPGHIGPARHQRHLTRRDQAGSGRQADPRAYYALPSGSVTAAVIRSATRACSARGCGHVCPAPRAGRRFPSGTRRTIPGAPRPWPRCRQHRPAPACRVVRAAAVDHEADARIGPSSVSTLSQRGTLEPGFTGISRRKSATKLVRT